MYNTSKTKSETRWRWRLPSLFALALLLRSARGLRPVWSSTKTSSLRITSPRLDNHTGWKTTQSPVSTNQADARHYCCRAEEVLVSTPLNCAANNRGVTVMRKSELRGRFKQWYPRSESWRRAAVAQNESRQLCNTQGLRTKVTYPNRVDRKHNAGHFPATGLVLLVFTGERESETAKGCLSIAPGRMDNLATQSRCAQSIHACMLSRPILRAPFPALAAPSNSIASTTFCFVLFGPFSGGGCLP